MGRKPCDQLCGKFNARKQLKLLESLGKQDEGKAGSSRGRAGQHPVPSSHHCALFGRHNCVSRAGRISLHFKFPAFCHFASQGLQLKAQLSLPSSC